MNKPYNKVQDCIDKQEKLYKIFLKRLLNQKLTISQDESSCIEYLLKPITLETKECTPNAILLKYDNDIKRLDVYFTSFFPNKDSTIDRLASLNNIESNYKLAINRINNLAKSYNISFDLIRLLVLNESIPLTLNSFLMYNDGQEAGNLRSIIDRSNSISGAMLIKYVRK